MGAGVVSPTIVGNTATAENLFPGAGVRAEGPGGGGFFDGMNELEKAFLLTAGLGTIADIGGGIYDRVKQSKDEKRERERKDRAGRSISAALSRPRSY